MRKEALAVALALASCGGSGTAGTAPSGGAGQSTAASAPSTASPGPSARAFRDLVGAANASPYKVSYRVTSTAGGQAVSGSQTWYVSGQKFRMDLALSQSGSAGSISIFATPDGSFSCVGQGGAPAQCFGLPAAQAFAQSPGAAFDASIRQNPDAFGASFTDTRSIAGTSASCYSVSGTASGFSKGTICYSGTGVPLLYQFDASGLSFTMEATSFGVPGDGDFTLPSPAQRP